ncbi:MAG: metal-dependent transcriptional regulator [Clostridia bacterium]|nr:metal-dependent transcriptional regulator [Clostridia bacterium]
MNIKESAQNYLETILILHKKNGSVRSIDVANYMNYTKASISVAMKHLRESDYIAIAADGKITLTPSGREIAEMLYERHQVIADILIALGVNEKTAYEDSCKIEHDLSEESFEKIKECLYKHHTQFRKS